MNFQVVVTRTAARQLAERLPESAAAACVEFVFGPLAENPYRVGRALRPPFEDQWRARRGVYRVRYRIDEAAQVVYVVDVDHRRDAYRISVGPRRSLLARNGGRLVRPIAPLAARRSPPRASSTLG